MAKRRQATIASKAKQARNLKAKGPKEAKINGEEITNGKPLAKDVTLKSKVAENSSIPKKIAKEKKILPKMTPRKTRSKAK